MESGKLHGGGVPWVPEEEDSFKQTGGREARIFLAEGRHEPLFIFPLFHKIAPSPTYVKLEASTFARKFCFRICFTSIFHVKNMVLSGPTGFGGCVTIYRIFIRVGERLSV